MGDHHLFSVMESLITITRMKRRQELDYLVSLIEMYDDTSVGYLSPETKEIQASIERVLDTINDMNTDAYGETHDPSYAPIMIEAAERGMREPFNPIHNKSEHADLDSD